MLDAKMIHRGSDSKTPYRRVPGVGLMTSLSEESVTM